jgi:protein-disulfide isomerase
MKLHFTSERTRTTLDLAASVLMILAAAALLWSALRAPTTSAALAAPPVPSQPLSTGDIPAMGSAQAAIALVVFSDFECPFCRQFANDILPQLETQYVTTGTLSVGFRHLPLAIHPHARQAAEFGVCAFRQGKFWPFHNAIFSGPPLANVDLRTVAAQIGMTSVGLDDCLKAASKQVDTDMADAKALQITGTPVILVGRRQGDGLVRVTQVIRGAQPLKVFTDAIDRLRQSS